MNMMEETGMIWMMIRKQKHTHMLKSIKEFLFGRRRDAVCTIITTLHTVQPKAHSRNFGEWCKEFNVSMLHDRKPIYY